MTILNNAFENVALYRDSGLAFMINRSPMINRFNKKFREFEKITSQLGDTVTYDRTPKFLSQPGLIVGSTNDAVQRFRSLTTDKSHHIAFDFSAEQYIFNAEEYMDKFGRSAIVALGTTVEADVESVAVKYTNKFFDFRGAGNLSYRNLAAAAVKFRTQGSTNGILEAYIPDSVQPDFIENGLSQFAPKRNDSIAMSWELGFQNDTNYYSCNLLPVQIAGNSADDKNADVLTWVSLSPAGDAITFSGGTDDAAAINENDLIVFAKASGLRFLTENGGAVTGNEVSVRATAVAASIGGEITVSIDPPLVSIASNPLNGKSNINQDLTVLDTATVIGDHRAGVIIGDKAGFLAMNSLPDTAPFPSYSKADPDTGANIRMYYGAFLGANRYMSVYDTIYGYDLDPERCLRLVFPV